MGSDYTSQVYSSVCKRRQRLERLAFDGSLVDICVAYKTWAVDGDGQHVRGKLDPKVARKLPKEGEAIIFDGINHPDALLLLERHRPRGLNPSALIQANGILSGPGYRCAIHFDCQHIVSLQLSGRKFWHFKSALEIVNPSVGWLDPRAPILLRSEAKSWPITPPSLSDMTGPTIVFPNDTISVPWGCWHTCYTPGYSFSLTLTYDEK